jgi:hypothetical protein
MIVYRSHNQLWLFDVVKFSKFGVTSPLGVTRDDLNKD